MSAEPSESTRASQARPATGGEEEGAGKDQGSVKESSGAERAQTRRFFSSLCLKGKFFGRQNLTEPKCDDGQKQLNVIIPKAKISFLARP